MGIRDASFRTWANLPVAGAQPAIRVATASDDEPSRALVNCLTGTVILSYDANELNVTGQAVGGRTFRIVAGNSFSFLMNPRQSLFAGSVAGPAVAISIALSDAFPVKVDARQ